MTLRTACNLGGRLATDVPFVTKAWLKASYYCPAYQMVSDPVHKFHEHRTIERLWADERVTWLFASYPDDVNFRFGFLCGEVTDGGPVVHWLYVRKSMQRFGVGTALMEAFLQGQDRGRVWETATTSDGRAFAQGSEALRGSEVMYNPWLKWEGAWR